MDDEKEVLRAKLHILNPAMWVLDNELVNENQHPIEFTEHRFMLQPYSDSSPEQVIRKSAQVGWSILAIIKSVHACNFIKLNVIYVLPTRNASGEFVVPKVDPMLKRNPVLAQMVKRTDNKSLKAIGDRWLYFKGAYSEGEAISTSADLIVADEYDRSNQLVLSMYQSRLQASKFRWFWRFSNPSLPGFGVDELFEGSDQMHWFVKCSHCGHEWYMNFERDIHEQNHYVKILNEQKDYEEGIYACGKCDKELTDDDRQSGRWLPKYPGRKRRGYWICQMMVPWVSASHIIKQKNDMTIDVFHNMVLGLPYQASEYIINGAAILRACNPGLALKSNVVIGCDSGKIKHWVMGNPEGIFAYGTTTDWADIEQLINMYNATCVIDALPDFTIPEQLARKYPGQVYVHYYTHNSTSLNVTERKEGMQFGVLQSDRTKLFDAMAARITGGQMRFFQTKDALTDIIYHFEQMYRVVEPDTKGILRATWMTKVGKPDHLAHACLSGDTVIETTEGGKYLCDVIRNDYVLTRKGMRKVLWSGITQRNARTFTVTLSNGVVLKGTADHPVYVVGKGFVALHTVAYGNKLLSWRDQKKLYSKASLIDDILTQRIEAIESTLVQAQLSEIRDERDITKNFGSSIMAQYQKVMRYITKTITRLTTTLRISSYLPSTNIKLTICKNDSGMQAIGLITKRRWTRPELSHMRGLKLKRAKTILGVMQSSLLNLKRQSHLFALVAARKALRIGLAAGYGAQEHVAIVSIKENSGLRDVYNLTVDEQPEFYANGVLVHNCAYYVVGLSVALLNGESGGVTSQAPSKQPTTYAVNAETQSVPVEHALGMPLDTLIERSISKHKRHKVI